MTNFTKGKININMTTPETGLAQRNPDPYNTHVPVIVQVDHSPFPTPLGVVPHFKTPSEYWPWDYGNS